MRQRLREITYQLMGLVQFGTCAQHGLEMLDPVVGERRWVAGEPADDGPDGRCRGGRGRDVGPGGPLETGAGPVAQAGVGHRLAALREILAQFLDGDVIPSAVCWTTPAAGQPTTRAQRARAVSRGDRRRQGCSSAPGMGQGAGLHVQRAWAAMTPKLTDPDGGVGALLPTRPVRRSGTSVITNEPSISGSRSPGARRAPSVRQSGTARHPTARYCAVVATRPSTGDRAVRPDRSGE